MSGYTGTDGENQMVIGWAGYSDGKVDCHIGTERINHG